MTELADISLDQLAEYQQAALMRLQVYVTGRVHAILLDFLSKITTRLNNYADDEGIVPSIAVFGLNTITAREWRDTFESYQQLLEAARYQAAAIPYGTLARQHQHFMGLLAEVEERASRPGPLDWLRTGPFDSLTTGRWFEEAGELPVVFETQIGEILQAASNRVYSDGFNLSQRIWRLDQDSLAGIQQTILNGVTDQQSAWELAQQLQTYLGVGQDCPRWTSTRLNSLTKADIAAGDRRGLITGNPCESKGVAYNALRLARNEIQIVHHGATDAVFKRSPWVAGENIVLSPAHPKPDICDEIVADNPYEPGEITLPLHTLCLCFKEAVLMKDADFTGKMRGWLDGSQPWPAMDQYALGLGADRISIVEPALLLDLAIPLLRWLEAPEAELDTVTSEATQEVVLG